jgi:hypothetical protein
MLISSVALHAQYLPSEAIPNYTTPERKTPILSTLNPEPGQDKDKVVASATSHLPANHSRKFKFWCCGMWDS